MKLMILIDGTWLYRSTPQLGRQLGDPEYHLDYGKLPQVLAGQVCQQLGVPQVDLVRTILFGSYPVNQHPEDDELADRAIDFLNMLREEYHYEVIAFPVNFGRRRLRKSDRDPADDFLPQEKCVDIALASDLLYYSMIPGAFDAALVVLGDRDFVPALKRTRQLGRRVLVSSIRRSCASVLAEPEDRSRLRDGDVIWLDALVREIELRYEPQQLLCESPLHVGEGPVWTRYRPRRGQPFFCEECRRKYTEQSRQLAQKLPADGAVEGPRPGERPGTVKRMGRGYGFLTDSEGGDFFFAPFSLAAGLIWEAIRVGDPVAFFPGEGRGDERAPQATAVRLRYEDRLPADDGQEQCLGEPSTGGDFLQD